MFLFIHVWPIYSKNYPISFLQELTFIFSKSLSILFFKLHLNDILFSFSLHLIKIGEYQLKYFEKYFPKDIWDIKTRLTIEHCLKIVCNIYTFDAHVLLPWFRIEPYQSYLNSWLLIQWRNLKGLRISDLSFSLYLYQLYF